VEALRPYGGTVLRIPLSREAEQQLMKILYQENLKVPTREQPTASARGAGLGDLIAALAPRALTLPGRVMWLRSASSSLVTKRTSEQERWTDEDRQ
jgi:hypothetical protein